MKRRAVSLVELMITLATLSVALGLMAGLVSQYQRLLFRESSQSLVASQLQQVNLIRNDLAQATEVLQPADSTDVVELLFTRVDPGAPGLESLPTPLKWEPRSPALSLTVHYYLKDQELRRSTTKQGNSLSDEVLLRSVSGFSAHRTGDGRVVVNFSFMERDVLRTLSCEVLPWVR